MTTDMTDSTVVPDSTRVAHDRAARLVQAVNTGNTQAVFEVWTEMQGDDIYRNALQIVIEM